MAQFQISPCTLSDLDAMIDVYMRAFRPTDLHQILFPPPRYAPASIRAWLSQRFQKFMTPGHAEMKLFKATDVVTGRLAAWSRWGYPFALAGEEKAEKEAASGQSTMMLPEGANEEACREYFAAVDGMREKFVRWDRDYICYLLATDPDFQRRGLGAMLLGQVMALADVDRGRIYLEATAEGYPLYGKLG